jgi:GGDEF domain-containing protein
MQRTDPTPEEIVRLKALKSLHLLDTPAEERFDRITRLATRIFGVSGAMIALADDTRFWLKSKQGVATEEVSRAISLCEYALHDNGIFSVADATTDERGGGDPFVRGDAEARFFAGVALKDRDGRRLGVICILDSKPRELNVDEQQSLRDLASLAQTEVWQPQREERTDGRGRLDAATGAWNRDATIGLLENQIESHLLGRNSIAVISMRVNNLPELGAGRRVGTELAMGEVAQFIRRCMRSLDGLGRIDEETFLVLLFNTDEHTMSDNAKRICQAVSRSLALGGGLVDLRFGVAGYVPGGVHDATELVKISSRDLMKPSRLQTDFPAQIAV